MSFGAKNLMGMIHSVAHGYDRSSPNIKLGYITSYDPARYAVRVRLEPESYANEQAGIQNPVIETNWIPIYRPFGGEEWGFKSPPKADPNPPYGDQALVMLPDGGHGVAFVGFYNNVERTYVNRPSGDPNDNIDLDPVAGEWQYVHQTGSFIKFRNDGTAMMFGKPQGSGLTGFPGASLLYLTDDGEVELRDSENNFLKMYATHQVVRSEWRDKEGNNIILRGAATNRLIEWTDTYNNIIRSGPNVGAQHRIQLQDGDGNNIRLRGPNTIQIELLDISNNTLKLGSNVGSSAMVLLQDGTGNALQMRGAAADTKISMVDTAGNGISLGPNIGDTSKVQLKDSDNNRLRLRGAASDVYIDLEDESGNILAMGLSGPDASRIALIDATGNQLLLRGNGSDRVILKDTPGNNLTFMGSSGSVRAKLEDSGGNSLIMGPVVSGSAYKIKLEDTDGNVLLTGDDADDINLTGKGGHSFKMGGGVGGISMVSPSGAFITITNSGNIVLITNSTPNAQYICNDNGHLFQFGASAVSGVVTLSHLQTLVTAINAALATKQNGSGSAGSLVATASTTMKAPNN